MAREYNLPIGTIRYIFNNYKKGYGFQRKPTGRPKKKDLTKEDNKQRQALYEEIL